ncbi:MAG: leucyl aminopeptidase [Woeseiaceae bacterium]
MRLISTIALLLLALPAAAQRPIEFMPFEWPESGSIVIPVAQGEALTGLAAELDERTDGAIAMAVAEAAFTGEKGQSLTLFAVKPYTRIDLIGTGADAVDRVGAEDFGGLAAGLNDGTSGTTVRILWSGVDREPGATAAHVAFGYRLGDYRFDRYHEDRLDPDARSKVIVHSDDAGAADSFKDDLEHVAAGVYLARNLCSEPGNVIYPETFVERVREEFAGLDNVRIRVLDENDLERLGMGAHLGVGRGSSRPPRLLVIEYFAGGDRPTIALAGKGITFDTGGVSIKKSDGMWMMKADMTGAAVVSATVLAAARRGAPLNIVSLAALAENMPSGTAIRPGDVLTSMSGKTIEIDSTDAEGRLVLSDAVHYAQVEYSPDVLIDVATLTGSVGRAVGPHYAGLFSLRDDLADRLLDAGSISGERLWRLPLDETYFKQIESDVADVKNGGAGGAGASVGAAFIGSFVAEDQVWAHLDIAGVDYTEEPQPTAPKGFTGWGIRLLDQYLRSQ